MKKISWNTRKLKIKIVKSPSKKGIYEFHVSRKCRDKYDFREDLFALNGNVIFANFHNAKNFTHKFIQKQSPETLNRYKIRASEISVIGLIDEIFHYIIQLYREKTDKNIISKAYNIIQENLSSKYVDNTFKLFLNDFPNNSIYKKKTSINNYLKDKTYGVPNSEVVLEELLMLWLSNINPAFEPYKELFDDENLKKRSGFDNIINELNVFFKKSPDFKPCRQSLVDMLRAPALNSPNSIKGQLLYILQNWGKFLGRFLYRILSNLDFLNEEDKLSFVNFHSTDILDFNEFGNEPERFTPDKEWMPKVVLITKSAYVWLDQLSKKYNRNIYRLDQIPDEELDQLKDWGFNALWLIGIWERSKASKKIKRTCGNPEAEASAYSLYDYTVASDLGGYDAYLNINNRAKMRGIRLACDMVPNHTGVDSKWIYEHPDWYISLDYNPFPSYSFNGENLSNNSDFGVYIDDHYYSRTDAAVVFKFVDFRNNSTKYIYHGNDGTGLPWNDTAQLNYLKPEVREAIIQKIIGISKMFSIIRFDAAMTLTKKHYQRLWFPQPGTGGDIPSRADFGMSREEFTKHMRREFWREVVDRIAKENPDTLLLAEAFWFMEGYFVRSLGMHRVYNSVFMNMLKSEENKNYRYTIKNVLEFNPEILKRFVNFMNNPDEETAVAQFGKGDKYFGICIMMCTMPGLPMFGHGQIEGFTEKYGMEYRRAYWNEKVDHDLVDRHKREIFPLLKKRYLFAEARNFLFYDFYTKNGQVNENVFAYSNSIATEKAIIVYNNKFDNANGWIKTSAGFLNVYDNKKITQRSLGEGLGLHYNENYFCIFKDFISGLYYIRSSKDIYENGIYVELGAYKYNAFMDIYEIEDNIWNHYSMLNSHVAGKGVKNINEVLKEVIYKPVHNLFRELINPGMLKFILENKTLQKNKKINKNMLDQVQNKINNLLKEIKKYINSNINEDELISEILQILKNSINLSYLENLYPMFELKEKEEISSFFVNNFNINDFNNWVVMFIYIFVSKLGKLVNKKNFEEHSLVLINDWILDKIIIESLIGLNIDEYKTKKILNLIKISIKNQNMFKNFSFTKSNIYSLFQKIISDSDIRYFINVNLYNDIIWFSKEEFEYFLNFIFIISFIELINNKINIKDKKKVIGILKIIKKWKEKARHSDYNLNKMLEIIND